VLARLHIDGSGRWKKLRKHGDAERVYMICSSHAWTKLYCSVRHILTRLHRERIFKSKGVLLVSCSADVLARCKFVGTSNHEAVSKRLRSVESRDNFLLKTAPLCPSTYTLAF